MNHFKDIVLLTDDMTEGMKSQQKKMNESLNIELYRIYPEGLKCICGKTVKSMCYHINSSKHKRFADKHGITINIIKRKRPKKEKKLKGGPKGRPPLRKPHSEDFLRERRRKYMMKHFDKNQEARNKHNERVRKYREQNRALCRERVKKSRMKKKEKELLEKEEV
jgi:hypothetical protein